MAEDGYNRNSIIGGYKGAPIKNSMLGKNLKTRGALSNNLPFRLANGLAPSNEYGFLFPTGTEAGAVWRFSQSGGQYQDTPGLSKVTAVGNAIGVQLDSRILPVSHSIDLNAKAKTYGGSGANTISVGTNTVSFNNAASGDAVIFSGGAEFPAAEFGRLEIVLTTTCPAGVNAFFVRVGNTNVLISPDGNPNTVWTAAILGAVTGDFQVQSFSAGLNGKVTILSITGYPGNHLSQATSTSRPLTAIETVGQWGQSVYSGRFDGVDDLIALPTFGAGTFNANMDFIWAVKRNSAGPIMLATGATGTSWIGACKNASATNASAGTGGAWLCFVDGVQIGTAGAATDGQLDVAITPNTWHVVEFRGLDMSSFTTFNLGRYDATYVSAENLGDVILCPAQSASNRALARTLVGASVGLLL